ncbi:hypothetical protein CXG81DRAFT_27211, partial [Caulochytrium protostelioides]
MPAGRRSTRAAAAAATAAAAAAVATPSPQTSPSVSVTRRRSARQASAAAAGRPADPLSDREADADHAGFETPLAAGSSPALSSSSSSSAAPLLEPAAASDTVVAASVSPSPSPSPSPATRRHAGARPRGAAASPGSRRRSGASSRRRRSSAAAAASPPSLRASAADAVHEEPRPVPPVAETVMADAREDGTDPDRSPEAARPQEDAVVLASDAGADAGALDPPAMTLDTPGDEAMDEADSFAAIPVPASPSPPNSSHR